MKIIISPAKKMKNYDGFPLIGSEPLFFKESYKILHEIIKLNFNNLKKILKCNDKIAREAFENYHSFEKQLSWTAITFFNGIQYNYMNSKVFTDEEYDFLQKHVFILSPFYGLIRPLDRIKPYRLEMESDLIVENKNLYEFWSEKITNTIFNENDILINLASDEYSRVVKKPSNKMIINIYFYERESERLIQKAVYCKMARGMMVRYIVENRIDNHQDIKNFNLAGYLFNKELSNDNNYIFIRDNMIKHD